MSSNSSSRSADTRLAAAAQAVDDLVARVRDTQVDLTGRMGRRVDTLRAHEAELRTRLRELSEAGPAIRSAHAAIDRDLDRLETDTAVAAARLETELAVDRDAFAAAVDAELKARFAQVDGLLTGAAAIEPLKAGVRQAMADLDYAVEEAAFISTE